MALISLARLCLMLLANNNNVLLFMATLVRLQPNFYFLTFSTMTDQRYSIVMAWLEGYAVCCEDNNITVTKELLASAITNKFNTPLYRSTLHIVVAELDSWNWAE